MGKNSARIFKVCRGTITRRVRLFDLEHLSLSSARNDEAVDSIIHDFVARHGSTIGELLSTRALEKKKAYQREPEPGRSEEHSFGVG